MFNLNGTKNRQAVLPTNPVSNENSKQMNQVNAPEVQPMPKDTDMAIESKIQEIEAQRRAFMSKNPDFDMRAEMQNPDFINYVWGMGLSVEDAYFLVHKEELLEQARREATEMLLERRNRIRENGADKNRPAIAKKNPKDLSDKEIDSIIERAKNGEKITF